MRFVDEEVRGLNPAHPDQMVKLVGLLCGECIDRTESDNELMPRILKDTKYINYEQLNEILLVLNQDRISKQFFHFFFEPSAKENKAISLNQFRKGVERFRGFAMLCYGNFRFAFKKFTSIGPEEFAKEVKRYCKLDAPGVRKRYTHRPRKAIEIQPIAKDKTWYVGYLSGRKARKDYVTFLAILLKLGRANKRRIAELIKADNWETVCRKLNVAEPAEIGQRYGDQKWKEAMASVVKETKELLKQVVKTASQHKLDAKRWESRLESVRKLLASFNRDIAYAQRRAKRNTDIYLTWDYMDVYVATSMRERWEYEATFKFLEDVFRHKKKLRQLKVRYFDPTQSYSSNRIDKGLVEGLMLKRAKRTLYLAQETDTLGKDSELAATLAQGKPVIAYVPEITNVGRYAKEIARQPVDFLWKRWLLLEAEEVFIEPDCLAELEKRFKPRLRRGKGILNWKDELFVLLRERIKTRTFNLVQEEGTELKSALGKKFEEMCRLVAVAEKHYFNKRAYTLGKAHPLAVQVDLASGVANGVLVVRNDNKCARLLYNLLTNDLSFRVIHSEGITELREEISGCPYRVVTDDAKLTNSFWNFYLTGEEAV